MPGETEISAEDIESSAVEDADLETSPGVSAADSAEEESPKKGVKCKYCGEKITMEEYFSHVNKVHPEIAKANRAKGREKHIANAAAKHN